MSFYLNLVNLLCDVDGDIQPKLKKRRLRSVYLWGNGPGRIDTPWQVPDGLVDKVLKKGDGCELEGNEGFVQRTG